MAFADPPEVASVELVSGDAWLPAGGGLMELVSGSAARTMTSAVVGQPGDQLTVVQRGLDGFVLDHVSGEIFRLDGSSTFQTSVTRPETTPGSDLRLFTAGPSLLFVDVTRGLAFPVDPSTLSVGPAWHVPPAAGGASMATDAQGRLWTLDTTALTWSDGVHSGHRNAVTANATLLSAGGRIVLVSAGKVEWLSDSGSSDTTADLSGPVGEQPTAIANDAGRLIVSYPRAGVAQVCDRSGCGHPIATPPSLTPVSAAVAGDMAAFADPELGVAHLFSASSGRPGASPRLVEPSAFALIERDGLLFYADPARGAVGVIRPDGTAAAVPQLDARSSATPTPPVSTKTTRRSSARTTAPSPAAKTTVTPPTPISSAGSTDPAPVTPDPIGPGTSDPESGGQGSPPPTSTTSTPPTSTPPPTCAETALAANDCRSRGHMVTLRVIGSGTMAATSASQPNPLTCASDSCAFLFPVEALSLTAEPSPGFEVTGWSVTSCGTSDSCALAADVDMVTVTFIPEPPTTARLVVDIVGAGAVVSADVGLTCTPTRCEADAPVGRPVTVRAVALSPGTVTWTNAPGCDSGTACLLTVRSAEHVGLTFTPAVITTPPDHHSVMVEVAGTGQVSSFPVGIQCGTAESGRCSYDFSRSADVALTASTPTPGWAFEGWTSSSGEVVGACGTSPTCTVPTGVTSVTATFWPVVTIELTGQGAIDVGTDSPCTAVECKVPVPPTGEITLTATTSTDHPELTTWTNCPGTDVGSTCTLPAEPTKVGATFAIAFSVSAQGPTGQLIIDGTPCRRLCSGFLSDGLGIDLTADPEGDSVFTWSWGGCSPNINPCHLTSADVSGDPTVTFHLVPPAPPGASSSSSRTSRSTPPDDPKKCKPSERLCREP